MKKLFKGTVVGLIFFVTLETGAKCFWEDVMVHYDGNCNIISIAKGGKEPTGADLEKIRNEIGQKLEDKKGICEGGGYFKGEDGEIGGSASTQVEGIRKEIMNMMLVTPEVGADGQSKKYLNNINSVRENQNKIKLNAATRSIALGKRSVALALESGEDIDSLRQEIESSNDMISLLKGIAKLQAQHLQKINQITALRSKLLELNSIDAIVAGDIHVNEDTSSSKN